MSALPEVIQSGPVVARPTGAVHDAVVNREVAEVQAAVMMAKRFPRDPVAALDRITNSCARSKLAEVALYEYARGGTDITGPSIRLAEAVAQNWGNVLSGVTILTSDVGKSECIAYAWDLETNYRDEKRFTVKHWRDTKKGGYALTDERDIYELAANMGARRKRACLLAVIPGDVIEAALHQCEITLHTKGEVTPERLKALIEKFAEFKVTQEMLEQRIQRRLDAMTPSQMVQLGKIYNSIKDGIGKAADYFAAPEGEEQAPEGQTRTESVKAKVKAAVAPVETGESSVLDPITDEAKALLALDASKDEGEGGAVLDRCKGQPFRARIVAAFNAKFPKTFG